MATDLVSQVLAGPFGMMRIKQLHFRDPILVTQALVPPFSTLVPKLKKILETHALSNQGEFTRRLESAVSDYLGVDRSAAFCNGMIALYLAILGFDLKGEIITTPFTFPATPHAIRWANCTPVFADIDPQTFTLDPDAVERRITSKTTAILPVHVFGVPCDVEGIGRIAKRHGLKVIYDAAHAFGVKYHGTPIARFGDASMFSFHATKIFNTLEGGALVSRDAGFLARVCRMRNFGFNSKGEVHGFGVNAKMNEIQAIFGLTVLDYVADEIRARKQRYERYRTNLASVAGLRYQGIPRGIDSVHRYMPLLITKQFGMSRQKLCDFLRMHNVFPRKYFFPLCHQIAPYKNLPSAKPNHFPAARQVAEEIICLPLYGRLPLESVDQICELLKRAASLS